MKRCTKTIEEKAQAEIDAFNPYCDVCGGCGYIGCDGVRDFLKKHVKGKTNCKNEDLFIDEIIWHIEHFDDRPKKEKHGA